MIFCYLVSSLTMETIKSSGPSGGLKYKTSLLI
uniref:Uncharacterized protein n=1 Tax=Cherax quadricarinatus TaxID=27406 RepID=G0ZJF5_CHEQU|nr:unknown [Cherax quadricarinatus]